jgi:ABC-type microcin C transport system permease subunit YejE
MNTYGAKMAGGRGMMMGQFPDLTSNPILVVGLIVHIAFTLVVFLILLFVCMLLWEKVKAEQLKNRELGKRRK